MPSFPTTDTKATLKKVGIKLNLVALKTIMLKVLP